MKRARRLIVGICSIAILTQTPVAFADTGSQLKQNINQLEKKRQSTLNNVQNQKTALSANQAKQSDLASQVQDLQTQIANSNYQIKVKQDKISKTQETIKELKDNIKKIQERIKQRRALIANRARAVYENGGSNSYLQLVLGADNFYDLVNRVVFVNTIAKQDQSILKQQESDNQQLIKNQQALNSTLSQLNKDLANLNQMKAQLDSKKSKEQSLLKTLKDTASKIQSSVSSQEKQAAIYEQQVTADKQSLSQWEAEQKREKEQVFKSSGGSTSVPFDIQPFIAPAQALEKSTGIPAAITLAQATLESDSGGQLSQLATEGKNLFGIKGAGPAGTIYLPTEEVYGGSVVTVDAGFKKYDSYYQCMVDHAQILQQPRYQYYLKKASNLQEYADGIQNGGYATDPQYALKLIYVIQTYGYAKFDSGSF